MAPLPRAADLFPPAAVFRAAIRGEIPRFPGPTPQFALVPASSHAGLSSCSSPRVPVPFPCQGTAPCGEGSEPGAGMGRPSGTRSQLGTPQGCALILLPPACPSSRHAGSVELCQNAVEGDTGAKARAQPPRPTGPSSEDVSGAPRSTPATHLRLGSSLGRGS